jgi:hypothetical protein
MPRAAFAFAAFFLLMMLPPSCLTDPGSSTDASRPAVIELLAFREFVESAALVERVAERSDRDITVSN